TIENEVNVIGDDALVSKGNGAKQKVARLFDEYEAKYDAEKIVVETNPAGDRITISADYQRSASLMFTDIPMNFHLYVQRQQTRAVGVINAIQDQVESSYNNSAQRYQKAIQQAAPAEPAPSGE